MASRADWNTQEKVDKTFEEMLALNGGNVAEITAHAMAKYLGCKPNTSLHVKVKVAKAKRKALLGASVEPVPAELITALTTAFDQMREQGISAVTTEYAAHAAKVSETAAHRAAADRQRSAEEERDYAELRSLCESVEQERDQAIDDTKTLLAAFDKLREENAELRGAKAALEAALERMCNGKPVPKGDPTADFKAETPPPSQCDRNDKVAEQDASVSASESEEATT